MIYALHTLIRFPLYLLLREHPRLRHGFYACCIVHSICYLHEGLYYEVIYDRV